MFKFYWAMVSGKKKSLYGLIMLKLFSRRCLGKKICQFLDMLKNEKKKS